MFTPEERTIIQKQPECLKWLFDLERSFTEGGLYGDHGTFYDERLDLEFIIGDSTDLLPKALLMANSVVSSRIRQAIKEYYSAILHPREPKGYEDATDIHKAIDKSIWEIWEPDNPGEKDQGRIYLKNIAVEDVIDNTIDHLGCGCGPGPDTPNPLFFLTQKDGIWRARSLCHVKWEEKIQTLNSDFRELAAELDYLPAWYLKVAEYEFANYVRETIKECWGPCAPRGD